MGKLFHFLSYNNAVPIVISVVILGAGSAYAANNPEVLFPEVQPRGDTDFVGIVEIVRRSVYLLQ